PPLPYFFPVPSLMVTSLRATPNRAVAMKVRPSERGRVSAAPTKTPSTKASAAHAQAGTLRRGGLAGVSHGGGALGASDGGIHGGPFSTADVAVAGCHGAAASPLY